MAELRLKRKYANVGAVRGLIDTLQSRGVSVQLYGSDAGPLRSAARRISSSPTASRFVGDQLVPRGNGAIPGGSSRGIEWGNLVRTGLGAIADQVAGQGDGGSPAVPSEGDSLVPGGGGGMMCPDGTREIFGRCIDLQPGGATQGGGLVVTQGEAVAGRYGFGSAPAVEMREHRSCPRGMVLGSDGICYDRRQLRRSDRAWVPGRKPLLTGGDLNAISRAARVAKKMERKAKDLQRLGLMKKRKR